MKVLPCLDERLKGTVFALPNSYSSVSLETNFDLIPAPLERCICIFM